LGWIHNGYVGRPTGGRAGWNPQKLKQWDHTSCAWDVHRDEHYYYYSAAQSHARIVPEFLIATFRRANSVSKRAPSAFHLLLTGLHQLLFESAPRTNLLSTPSLWKEAGSSNRLIAQVLKAVIDDRLVGYPASHRVR
jgi:hypothetical protein